MTAYKIKRFSKIPYVDLKQRIKDTSIASLFGAGVGIIPGALVGSIFGKTGTKVGAALGAGLGGYALGKMNWNITSKEWIDEKNKRLEKQQKENEKYLKNPKIFLNPVMNKKDLDYKDLELPKEFFKLLQVNRKFISVAEKLMKEKKVLWLPKFIVLEAKLIKQWKEYNQNDEGGITIMIDPEQADDTFINWYSEDNSYSFDFDDQGRFKTLKSALIEALSISIDYSDDTYLLEYDQDDPKIEIDKAYLEFIIKNL